KSISIPPTMAIDAFQNIQSVYANYKKTVAIEKTKRHEISAWRNVEISKIQAQKEILELYLKESFKERAIQIEHLFIALDKGIDLENMDIVGNAMASIVAIAKESPLAQAREAISALKDPTIKSIDW
ncbi:MAG: hypothetical protein ACRDCX_06000, partial [Aeromonas sp.]